MRLMGEKDSDAIDERAGALQRWLLSPLSGGISGRCRGTLEIPLLQKTSSIANMVCWSRSPTTRPAIGSSAWGFWQ